MSDRRSMMIVKGLVAVGARAEDEVPLFYDSLDERGQRDERWARAMEFLSALAPDLDDELVCCANE